eukprot:g2646.t1
MAKTARVKRRSTTTARFEKQGSRLGRLGIAELPPVPPADSEVGETFDARRLIMARQKLYLRFLSHIGKPVGLYKAWEQRRFTVQEQTLSYRSIKQHRDARWMSIAGAKVEVAFAPTGRRRRRFPFVRTPAPRLEVALHQGDTLYLKAPHKDVDRRMAWLHAVRDILRQHTGYEDEDVEEDLSCKEKEREIVVERLPVLDERFAAECVPEKIAEHFNDKVFKAMKAEGGSIVQACRFCLEYYCGKIAKTNASDDTYYVEFDDGGKRKVPRQSIKHGFEWHSEPGVVMTLPEAYTDGSGVKRGFVSGFRSCCTGELAKRVQKEVDVACAAKVEEALQKAPTAEVNRIKRTQTTETRHMHAQMMEITLESAEEFDGLLVAEVKQMLFDKMLAQLDDGSKTALLELTRNNKLFRKRDGLYNYPDSWELTLPPPKARKEPGPGSSALSVKHHQDATQAANRAAAEHMQSANVVMDHVRFFCKQAKAEPPMAWMVELGAARAIKAAAAAKTEAAQVQKVSTLGEAKAHAKAAETFAVIAEQAAAIAADAECRVFGAKADRKYLRVATFSADDPGVPFVPLAMDDWRRVEDYVCQPVFGRTLDLELRDDLAGPRTVVSEARRQGKRTPNHSDEDQYLDAMTGRPATFGSVFDDATVDVSFVVPMYNEEERLPVMMDEALTYLRDRVEKNPQFTFEILLVDDGSRDRTVALAQEFATRRPKGGAVRVLRLHQNHGKGGAVRKGMLRAQGRRLLMVDADGATKIDDLAKLESKLAGADHGVAVGSRAHLEADSVAERSFFRTVLMKGFHLFVSIISGVRGVKDTQCGFKLFTRDTARALFPSQHIERWAFDVELLYLAGTQGIPVHEVAVNWQEIDGSKLDVATATVQMARDLVLIRFCYLFGLWRLEAKNKSA